MKSAPSFLAYFVFTLHYSHMLSMYAPAPVLKGYKYFGRSAIIKSMVLLSDSSLLLSATHHTINESSTLLSKHGHL